MDNCPLAFNVDWPIVFASDNSIVIIVDKYVIKKYCIDEIYNTLKESGTIIDWDSLMGPTQF